MPIVTEDVRKLATVEQITSIRPIAGADAIEQATVRGWTVVTKKGEFSEGDMVVYFETDTALPVADKRFSFLAPRGVKTVEGEDFHVLKTARLRGVYSQGLVLPFSLFWQDIADFFPGMEAGHLPVLGTDVTHPLGLGKWEAPLPVGNGDTAGPFLTKFARKTDSERIQNLVDVWPVLKSVKWDATEKVDGTSCTVVRDEEGDLRVMGRNWEIREGDNTYWNVVNSPRFAPMFELLEPGDALQMEVAGVGIQGNKLKLSDVRPFVFDYSRNGVMVPRHEWPDLFLKWAVPTVEVTLPETAEELLALVDGVKSLINPQVLAEGVVFHTADGSVVPEVGNRNTFKVISNKWLTRNNE